MKVSADCWLRSAHGRGAVRKGLGDENHFLKIEHPLFRTFSLCMNQNLGLIALEYFLENIALNLKNFKDAPRKYENLL